MAGSRCSENSVENLPVSIPPLDNLLCWLLSEVDLSSGEVKDHSTLDTSPICLETVYLKSFSHRFGVNSVGSTLVCTHPCIPLYVRELGTSQVTYRS